MCLTSISSHRLATQSIIIAKESPCRIYKQKAFRESTNLLRCFMRTFNVVS